MELYNGLKPSRRIPDAYTMLYDVGKFYKGGLAQRVLELDRVAKSIPSQATYRSRLIANVEQFVFNCIAARSRERLVRKRSNHEVYLAIPLRSVFKEPSRYRPSHLSYKYARLLLDTLSEIGWIDHHPGSKSENEVTIFRPVGDFAQLLDEHLGDVPGNVEFALSPELVELKDGDKRLSGYADNDFSNDVRSTLEAYNRKLSNHEFSIRIPISIREVERERGVQERSSIIVPTSLDVFESPLLLGVKPEFTEGHLTYRLKDWHVATKRVFNRSSWYHGGRFYCRLQNFPVSIRKWITIDGERATEVDFKSLHPAMLYNKDGHPLDHDPYDIGRGETARDAAKEVFLTFINAKNYQEAYGSVKQEAAEGNLDLAGIEPREYVHELKSRNSLIKEYFHSDKGIVLQRWDAELALRITNRISPCLVVHDSFIVKKSQQQELEAIMKEEYERVFGFDIKVEVEY